MLGAIIGDIAGSRFQWDNLKSKEFRLLYKEFGCEPTDDSIMTLAIEDAIRNAISIGGDSDTIAAITGGVAEAYYGIPLDIREKTFSFLDDELTTIVLNFESKFGKYIDERTMGS